MMTSHVLIDQLLNPRNTRQRDELEEDFSRTKSKMREAENRADDLERDVRRANNAREEAEDNLVKSKRHAGDLDQQV
jgi:chromosome segregation ATPase